MTTHAVWCYPFYLPCQSGILICFLRFMFSKSASKNFVSSVSREARAESWGDLDRENKLLGQDKDLDNRMGLDSN